MRVHVPSVDRARDLESIAGFAATSAWPWAHHLILGHLLLFLGHGHLKCWESEIPLDRLL